MAYCKKCGATLEENVKFCQACGAPVDEAAGEVHTAHLHEEVVLTLETDEVIPLSEAQPLPTGAAVLEDLGNPTVLTPEPAPPENAPGAPAQPPAFDFSAPIAARPLGDGPPQAPLQPPVAPEPPAFENAAQGGFDPPAGVPPYQPQGAPPMGQAGFNQPQAPPPQPGFNPAGGPPPPQGYPGQYQAGQPYGAQPAPGQPPYNAAPPYGAQQGYGQPYGQQPYANQPGVYAKTPEQDIQDNKAMAVLAYFGLLVLIPILAAKDSPYARYHANQGLVLLIFGIVGNIAAGLLSIVTFGIAYVAFAIFSLVITIMGIVNAASGKMAPLPLIGRWTILS